MTLLERIKDLCSERGINPSKLEIELGFGRSTLYKWEKSSPTADKIEKVADYFNVSVDYLLGKTESKIPLQKKDSKHRKDIAQEVDKLLEGIESDNGLMFDGEAMDEETRQALRYSLTVAVETARKAAKEKFTPKKYRN